MPTRIPLAMHTAYADLVDRCAVAAFESAFASDGNFVAKTVRARKYWYFQEKTPEGRRQKYVGPETEELLEQIARHRSALDDVRDRQALVSMLVRSAYLPRPQVKMGEVLQALAEAGVFRLRAVLVGTIAYQTYGAMLGVRLPAVSLQTGDVDIAQHRTISVATDDKSPSPLSILKEVDASFRAVPHIRDSTRSTSCLASGGLRVDFLTPNRGADSGEPQPLPALATDAHPLRFLDYLIHEPVYAVLLHGAGVYVTVPAPERYALHKLILAQRPDRPNEKKSKDVVQAEGLISVIAEDRPYELSAAWNEAVGRGKKWRQSLARALTLLKAETRDALLKTVGENRSFVIGLDLEFAAPLLRYEPEGYGAFSFYGTSGGERHRCVVTLDAIEDYLKEKDSEREFEDIEIATERARRALSRNLDKFKALLREKFLREPISTTNETLLTAVDIGRLNR